MSQAQRRLLDLLAGWGQYVHKCSESEEPHPGVTSEEYNREAYAIDALYQEAGKFENMSEHDICDFVRDLVLPLLGGDEL